MAAGATQAEMDQLYAEALPAYIKRGIELELLDPRLGEFDLQQVLVLGQLVHEAVPQLKCLVVEQTYLQDPSWPDIDPAVDIWCPLWSFIDRESISHKIAHGDEALVAPDDPSDN